MFFKLKQDSIKNNKIIRYFIYAFGEVIIVIVGVLLAISFNNYNTSTNNNSQAYDYILKIQDDLLADQQHLSGSLITAENNLLLLNKYFLHFNNLDTLPVNTLREIIDISLGYPYNQREKNIFLSVNQNIFANAGNSTHDMVDRINQYYHYCVVLDNLQTNNLSLYNKAINFWITSKIDIYCEDKEILIDLLSSNKYKNLLFFKKEYLQMDKTYFQHCVNFNEAVMNEIRDFLTINSN